MQEYHVNYHIYVFLSFQYIGLTGFVVTIHNCGDVIVRFPFSKVFQLNPDVLTKVSYLRQREQALYPDFPPPPRIVATWPSALSS